MEGKSGKNEKGVVKHKKTKLYEEDRQTDRQTERKTFSGSESKQHFWNCSALDFLGQNIRGERGRSPPLP